MTPPPAATATPEGPAVLLALEQAWRAGALDVLGRSRLGRPIFGRLVPPAAGAPDPAAAPAGAAPPGALLVVGGVHGDEPSTVGAALELLSRLAISGAGRAGWVLVVPALNPDGLAQNRKNSASDVDLNRNFPARNFARAHAPGYDPGPSPLSEPETVLLAALMRQRHVYGVVAVHAPFACVNFDGPAGGWAGAVAAACGWPVRESIGYPTPGSLGSWWGVDQNRPILTLELPPGPLAGFRDAAAAALDCACACAPFPEADRES